MLVECRPVAAYVVPAGNARRDPGDGRDGRLHWRMVIGTDGRGGGAPARQEEDGTAADALRTVERVMAEFDDLPPEVVVAEEVARLSTEGPPPYTAVEFALAQHGIIEPSPHLLVVRADGDDPRGVAREMAGRLPAILTASRFTRATWSSPSIRRACSPCAIVRPRIRRVGLRGTRMPRVGTCRS